MLSQGKGQSQGQSQGKVFFREKNFFRASAYTWLRLSIRANLIRSEYSEHVSIDKSKGKYAGNPKGNNTRILKTTGNSKVYNT